MASSFQNISGCPGCWSLAANVEEDLAPGGFSPSPASGDCGCFLPEDFFLHCPKSHAFPAYALTLRSSPRRKHPVFGLENGLWGKSAFLCKNASAPPTPTPTNPTHAVFCSFSFSEGERKTAWEGGKGEALKPGGWRWCQAAAMNKGMPTNSTFPLTPCKVLLCYSSQEMRTEMQRCNMGIRCCGFVGATNVLWHCSEDKESAGMVISSHCGAESALLGQAWYLHARSFRRPR